MSNRMLEVLQDMAEGLSVKASAERRFLAISTLKTHRIRVMAFLNARNAAHAVGIALRTGLISADKIEPKKGWSSEETQDASGCSDVPGSGAGVQEGPTEEVGQGPVVPGVQEVRREARTRNDPDEQREGRQDGMGGDDVRRTGPPVAAVRRTPRSYRYTGDSD